MKYVLSPLPSLTYTKLIFFARSFWISQTSSGWNILFLVVVCFYCRNWCILLLSSLMPNLILCLYILSALARLYIGFRSGHFFQLWVSFMYRSPKTGFKLVLNVSSSSSSNLTINCRCSKRRNLSQLASVCVRSLWAFTCVFNSLSKKSLSFPHCLVITKQQ
jgi:hypothetical protein